LRHRIENFNGINEPPREKSSRPGIAISSNHVPGGFVICANAPTTINLEREETMAKSEFPEREDDRFGQQLSNVLPRQYDRNEREMPSSYRSQRNEWQGSGKEIVQAQRLARALGWFSIGLGVAEVAVPRTVARLAGMNGHRGLVRALGMREIAHGVGILSRRKPVGWLWSRVFGDVIDLAVLGKAAALPNANKRRIAAAAAAVTGVTVLDFKSSQQLTRVADQIEDDHSIHVAKSMTINRSAEEIYKFWRDFKNLPRVMEHLESVEVLDNRRSRWIAKGPAGKRVEWEAEITEDRPNELIAWRSIEGSTVDNSGAVRFQRAPGGRGTVLHIELDYRPPAGLLGATIAKLLGEEPEIQLEEDIRRLKQLMEAGEIITTEGQPAGRAKSTSWKYDYAGRRLAAAF
jgi:uncharacterized membrane protein